MSSDKLNYVLFLLLASFWGGSFVGIKFVVNAFPPLFGAMLRVALALFFLIIIFHFAKKKVAVPFSSRWKIWIVGLFAQGLPFFFLFWGERLISPGLAGILNGTVPIWAFLLSLAFVKNHNLWAAPKLFGLFLGVIGIFVIFSPMLSLHGVHSSIWGALSVLMMAISYAIGALLNQHLFARHTKIDFYANIYHQHWASVTFLFLTSCLLESWPSWHVIINAHAALLASVYLGLFSTALAWIMYYHLIREWDAVRASTATYVAPIMALFWDFLFFHDRPVTSEIVGVIIVLSGVILIQFVNKQKKGVGEKVGLENAA